MLPGAEFAMRWAAMEQAAEFRRLATAGEIAVRDVVSSDNPYERPDYDQQDPFYGGPIRSGGAALRFADLQRPDLGEIPA